MKYEVVELQEKRVLGIKTRTNNQAADMGAKIGHLWSRFFEEGLFFRVPGKINEKSIGLYTNYESDQEGDYDLYACCEVADDTNLVEGLEATTISAGRYAKFIVKGNMQTAVYEFWTKLWSISLDRKYDCDFEEYQPGEDMENCEIHVYIGLN